MNAWAITAAAIVLLLLAANRRAALASVLDDGTAGLPDAPGGIDAEQAQGGALDGLAILDPATYWPTMIDTETRDANRAATLMAIRKAEGTAGPDGYRTMFGYRYFDSFDDHPRQAVQFTDQAGRRLWTSAAGAYQFMAVSRIPGSSSSTRVDTWDRMQRKLGLPDFSPASQDLAALALILEAGAMNDVDAGRFDLAISKIRGIWASLPGAGYGQPERTLASLRNAFTAAGGILA